MHKKGIRQVGWVENPTNLQAVLNVGFINPTYAVVTWRSVSLFYAFHYIFLHMPVLPLLQLMPSERYQCGSFSAKSAGHAA